MASDPTFPTLETERLVLREITADDAPALFAIHSDAEAMKWFGNDPLESLDGAHKLIEAFKGWRSMPNPGTRFGLELKSEPGLIGTCGLFRWNRGWRACAIGYELATPRQGRGLMVEAARRVIDWGFTDEMQLNRIEAHIHPFNMPSLTLAKRIGFVEEGRVREAGFWGGQFQDLLQLSLLKSDWTPAQSSVTQRVTG